MSLNEIQILNNKINKEKQIQKLIQIETNKKLEKFSRIYFNKTKKNYQINEK